MSSKLGAVQRGGQNGVEVYSVKQIHVHPDYIRSPDGNDIALLEVDLVNSCLSQQFVNHCFKV